MGRGRAPGGAPDPGGRQRVLGPARLAGARGRRPRARARLGRGTAAWKRDRLAQAGISVPGSATYVEVDFERDDLGARLSEGGLVAGEPMRSSFEPADLHRLLRGAGFDEVEDLGRAEILPRFFGAPAVGAGGGGHVVRARRTG